MTEPATRVNVWPTWHGDHRGAMGGRGAGAASGRIRWAWRAPADVARPLVGNDRIFVQVENAIHVLDASGVECGRIAIEDDWRLQCLVGDLVVVSCAQSLEARDVTGKSVWRYTSQHPIRRVHVGPEDEVVVWTFEDSGLRCRSELTWLDANGKASRATPYAFTIPGLVLDMAMAFDDDGILYTLWLSRMGDGVSGSDVAHGGIAAYDFFGCRFARRPSTPSGMRNVYADASGAICAAMTGALAVTRDGDYAWTSTGDDAVSITLGDSGIELVGDPRLARIPDVTQRNSPQRSTGLHGAFDNAGNFYFATMLWGPPRSDRILSLDRERRVRWILELEPVNWAAGPPVIGLADTILFPYGSTLLAIE